MAEALGEFSLDLQGGPASHVVAVVGSAGVVVVGPGLQGCLQQCDVVDAAAVEVWAEELPQHGAVEPLADRVVVRAPGRDAVMGQAHLLGLGLERLPGEFWAVEFLADVKPGSRF